MIGNYRKSSAFRDLNHALERLLHTHTRERFERAGVILFDQFVDLSICFTNHYLLPLVEYFRSSDVVNPNRETLSMQNQKYRHRHRQKYRHRHRQMYRQRYRHRHRQKYRHRHRQMYRQRSTN